MKLCLQTGDIIDRIGFERGYKLFKECGFEAVDWNIDHAWKNSDIRNGTYEGTCIFEKSIDEVMKYYSEELSYIKNNGLIISQAHAPFPAYVKGHPEVTDYAVKIYKRCIELCDKVGCRNLVIHGISLQIDDNQNTTESVKALNYKLYSSLIPVLKNTDVIVCLENLFTCNDGKCYMGHCCNPYDAAQEIDRLNEEAGKECFGLCLDTGHLNILSMDFRYYVSILRNRIKALHIHDNDGNSDLHKAPLTGNINWNHFCDSLRSAGYSGDLDFETFNQTNKVMDFDEEMLVPWLLLIEKTGEILRNKIIS